MLVVVDDEEYLETRKGAVRATVSSYSPLPLVLIHKFSCLFIDTRLV